ncbi:Hypothetical protein LUCI_0189 [Lucifera butyrica]|uniref:ABC-2 type transporter transmembrane domain-containing protein n=1 Tax=Lucifera butyrica TaxID=1351585 RepID=A0A498R481_9FIRM|nr:ABC transporter permease [Lucifera butyrica]VBB04983.1 Hypothetical protein LUCI_0189 [Lucifera butyrica]
MNWRHIIKRELRQMFITDRRRAVFLFGASLAYLILFSLLYGPHVVNSVPLVIYDEDQTQFSRELIQEFYDSEKFQIVSYVTTQEDMERELREKKAYAAVHIPRIFAQDAKSGMSSTVLVMVNGSNIIITNTVTAAAQEIVAAFTKETGTGLTETNYGQLPAPAMNKTGPVALRFRVLNNPTQDYLGFFVMGLSMAAFQQGVFLPVGASLHSEFRYPEELGNAGFLQIMAGKLFPYWLSAISAFFITIAAAVHIFGIPVKASIPDLFLLSSTFIFAAVAFGSFLASICNTELTFTRASIIYTVPAFVVSGYSFPQESMDLIGKTASSLFPLSYFNNTLRDLMLAGYSPFLYRNSLILLLMGITLIVLATVCYIWRLKQTRGMVTGKSIKA